MSIKAIVNELEQVNNELKRYLNLMKPLKQRKVELQNQIAEYLKSKDQIGLKHEDKAIIIEQKEIYAKKSKQDKESDVKKLLEKYNIKDSEKFFNDLNDAKRGEFQELKDKVIVKKVKKKKN